MAFIIDALTFLSDAVMARLQLWTVIFCHFLLQRMYCTRGNRRREQARRGGRSSRRRRRGTRQTSAVQCPRRAEGEIAIAAPEGEVQPEQRRNAEQREVRKLRQFFHQRRGIG